MAVSLPGSGNFQSWLWLEHRAQEGKKMQVGLPRGRVLLVCPTMVTPAVLGLNAS